MVNMSFPIFPNCKITFSCSAAETLWDGSTAATSWKFLTEATVTRPLKFRHQHCSCSCHLGALFFSTMGSAEPWLGVGSLGRFTLFKSVLGPFPFSTGEGEKGLSMIWGKDVGVGAVPPSWIAETGMEFMVQCILLGPLARRTFNSYAMVPTRWLNAETLGDTCLEWNLLLDWLSCWIAAPSGGWLS